MKDYYKIGEISNLYDIGPDSLRYYEEIGILSPARDVNGYRMYGISEIRTLNILRELRSLGFSMEEIKDHLNGFTLSTTMELFEKEISHINARQKELEDLKKQLNYRIASIKEGIAFRDNSPEIRVVESPERKLITLNDNVTRDEELDFTIKKLQKKTESRLSLIGNGHIGATIPLQTIKSGHYGCFTRAFCIVDDATEDWDDVLPAGKYLSRIVKGSYSDLLSHWKEMFNKANEEKLIVCDDPIELYIIDNHDTSLESEYLTLLQMRVK